MLYGLAQAAKKYNSTVVCVNRPLCRFSTFIMKPERTQEFFDKPKLEQLDDNLYLFSPRYFIHDLISARSTFLENQNLKALRKAYQDLTGRLGIDESRPLIWFYHPVQAYVTKLFEGSISIMELVDNLTDFSGREDDKTDSQEQAYRDKIDLLLTSTQTTLDKYGQYYKTVWLSGNGLDRATFEKLSRPELMPAAVITAYKSPRIGYTGNISDRIDWDMMASVAQAQPDWNFIFVGTVDKSVPMEKLRAYKNIIFTGRVEHDKIPGVLKAFDVGIMPYKANDFFRFSNPLKFYEFAAAGVRMISSNMEWLNNFDKEFVRIVENDPAKWIEALEHFLNSDREAGFKIGREIASQYIWDDMSKKLLDKIAKEFFDSSN